MLGTVSEVSGTRVSKAGPSAAGGSVRRVHHRKARPCPAFANHPLRVNNDRAEGYVDVSCGVPPKQFTRGEWFVTIALLTGIIWVLCDTGGLPLWASALIAFVVGYTVRVLALYFAWEEPLAKGPKGVYLHDDGRPMPGTQTQGQVRAGDGNAGPHRADQRRRKPVTQCVSCRLRG